MMVQNYSRTHLDPSQVLKKFSNPFQTSLYLLQPHPIKGGARWVPNVLICKLVLNYIYSFSNSSFCLYD